MATCPPEKCPPAPVVPAKVKPCAAVSFSAGNYDVNYDGRCLAVVRERAVPDGWYNRVRLVNGNIVEAQTASGQIINIESPCGAADSGTGGGVSIAADACNLTRLDGNGSLLTRFFANFGAFLDFNGCGSSSNPLNVDLNIDAVRSEVLAGGMNYDQGGYRIVDGLVQTFVLPITGLASDTPGLSVTRVGTEVRLSLGFATGSVGYMRTHCVGNVLKGIGTLYRGAGNGCSVKVMAITSGDQGSMPSPPSSFPTVQEGINWMDSNLTVCQA